MIDGFKVVGVPTDWMTWALDAAPLLFCTLGDPNGHDGRAIAVGWAPYSAGGLTFVMDYPHATSPWKGEEQRTARPLSITESPYTLKHSVAQAEYDRLAALVTYTYWVLAKSPVMAI